MLVLIGSYYLLKNFKKFDYNLFFSNSDFNKLRYDYSFLKSEYEHEQVVLLLLIIYFYFENVMEVSERFLCEHIAHCVCSHFVCIG